jgi:hypothetical protein
MIMFLRLLIMTFLVAVPVISPAAYFDPENPSKIFIVTNPPSNHPLTEEKFFLGTEAGALLTERFRALSEEELRELLAASLAPEEIAARAYRRLTSDELPHGITFGEYLFNELRHPTLDIKTALGVASILCCGYGIYLNLSQR